MTHLSLYPVLKSVDRNCNAISTSGRPAASVRAVADIANQVKSKVRRTCVPGAEVGDDIEL
jgi:hypothetical protein